MVCLPIIICVGSSAYYFLLLQVTPGIFRTWQPSARETGPKNFLFLEKFPYFLAFIGQHSSLGQILVANFFMNGIFSKLPLILVVMTIDQG